MNSSEEKLPRMVPLSELRLADMVSLERDGNWPGYSTGTVQQITEEEVHILRPYVITSDFSYTGGVITSLGWEEVKYQLDGNTRDMLLIERKALK